MGYWGKTFFSFFQTFFYHFYLFIQGKYAWKDLATDEIQLIALVLISISAAIVGCFLVVRKMTMVANAISHTVLLGIVIAFLIMHFLFQKPFSEILKMDLNFMLLSGLIASFLTIGFTDFFSNTLGLSRDSSIGLSFTFLFSLGITLVTIFTRNIHIGAEVIMGNVDLIHIDDLMPMLLLLIFNILLLLFFYKEYKVTSFDPRFSKLIKISPFLINALIIFQTSITLIASFRAVGVILVLSLLVVPCQIAKMFSKRLIGQIVFSCFFAILASFITVALSRHILTVLGFSLSTSGLLVVVLSLMWTSSVIYFRLKKLKFMNNFKRLKKNLT